jgi:hypothetical protein
MNKKGAKKPSTERMSDQLRRNREMVTALSAMQAMRNVAKFAEVLSESHKRRNVALTALADDLDGRPYIPADVVAARFDEDAEMLEEFSLMIGEALGCLDARFPWKAFEDDARRGR